MAEKRQYQRVEFDSDVELQLGELICSVKLHDISMHGAMVSQPEQFPAQRGLNVALTLPLSGLDEIIHVEATIQHIGDGHMGLEFSFVDIDSISRLRRLLEMNLVSEASIERELATLITTPAK